VQQRATFRPPPREQKQNTKLRFEYLRGLSFYLTSVLIMLGIHEMFSYCTRNLHLNERGKKLRQLTKSQKMLQRSTVENQNDIHDEVKDQIKFGVCLLPFSLESLVFASPI